MWGISVKRYRFVARVLDGSGPDFWWKRADSRRFAFYLAVVEVVRDLRAELDELEGRLCPRHRNSLAAYMR
jgi:hypothetical protein